MNLLPPTERQARVIWLALTGLGVALLIALCAASIWGLGKVLDIMAPVLWPIAVAGVLSYLLDPVVDFVERRGASRTRAIVTVFALAMVIVGALFGSIVPPLVSETRDLADRVPIYASKLGQRFENWISNPPPWAQRFLQSEPGSGVGPGQSGTNLPPGNLNPAATGPTTNTPPLLVGALAREDVPSAASQVAGKLTRIGAWLFGRVASVFGILVGLALLPVYTFYFLLEKRGISSR